MSPDFGRRSARLELMDSEDVSEADLRRTFRELALINRRLGGHAATLRALESLIPPGLKRVRILDVGCGDGDAASFILDWAQARGLEATVHGIDLSAVSVRLAAARERPGLSFACRDLFALESGEDYDIVHAGLLLHHCPGAAAVRALKAMHSHARLGVAVNDLHRHPAAYYAIKALTAAFSRDRLIRHDAPLSVLRGFSRAELRALCREAGLAEPVIHWRWAFRWQVELRA